MVGKPAVFDSPIINRFREQNQNGGRSMDKREYEKNSHTK